MEIVNSGHKKTVAYLDCPTGIAGDMCLGALIDLGVPLEYLEERLGTLGIESEYHLKSEKIHRGGQIATKVHVDLTDENHHHHHHHNAARHLPEIELLIKRANLSDRAREWSLKVFRNLAVAESAVHGIPPEKVHFHEVGATDAIIDIVGTCIGLDRLGVEELYCSPLPTGRGTVKAAHGILAVPVPAVMRLWESRGVPIYDNGLEGELVTPTGAAIVTTLATDFGPPPAMNLTKIGLGAGTKNFSLPNILRLWLGYRVAGETDTEEIAILETGIDDLEPRAIAYLFDRLLEEGALDVFTTPVTMKKSRSGILLTVLCPPDKISICESIVFRETTTLGIRRRIERRSVLKRRILTVETPRGPIRVKIGYRDSPDEPLTVQPEYEDCAEIARRDNIPWRSVLEMAREAYRGRNLS